MSVHVSSWAWRQPISDSGTKIVLLKLADSANDLGVAWPSQLHLAEHCGMSDRNVRFKLEKLVELALIKVERSKKPDGTWNPNIYRLSSGSPLPMAPEEIQRKPTSSETPLEPSVKEGHRKPTSTGSWLCHICGLEFNERQLVDHRRNVHGEDIPLSEEAA